ncbi:ABC transporter ATP-binding protein [Terribacillus sp. DMT04]|uniref:ABC transporter ATP-binding protein n=1 Tax=Terribacillus sp. DMT04 TaxID=2850441 RepID=UPI001C2C7271|nr:ABC transporter ATP-binding protein [Terribacillus sp. DMT04]QXE02898.1 energy-coupling factor ABC transporter ATP-binding protein [Terribacillus sp. DMT04]
MKDILLEVNQLSVTFEEESRPTLNELSFSIKKGDSILLLGPSGSGKSTLTYCLNGLYPKELDGEMGGTISFCGKSLQQYASGQLNLEVGTVFQDPETQFCMLTVEDEIAFGLENKKTAPGRMDAEIERVPSLVGLAHRRKDKIHTLSGGQKQKLALAAVLALNPSMLILDEPTANLDPAASNELAETIHQLKEQQNLTLLIIEHNIDYWLPVINRTILLDQDGTLFFDGEMTEAINQYDAELEQRGIWLPEATRLAKSAKLAKPWPLAADQLPKGLTLHAERQSANQFDKVLLRIDRGRFKSKDKLLLDIPSLVIHRGEFIAITGRNGSGKTLLSQMMTGLLKHASGKIEFMGKQLKRWKQEELYQQIGYVFQNPEHQFLSDSVREEIAFGQSASTAKTEKLLKEIQLIEHADKHPFLLSQGQKRRLSVATMLVQEPQLLVLDEPTFGQDSRTTAMLMQQMTAQHQRGCTIVMITHDMELVNRYASRVLLVNEGKIILDNTPELLWKTASLAEYGLSLPLTETYQQQEQKVSLHA